MDKERIPKILIEKGCPPSAVVKIVARLNAPMPCGSSALRGLLLRECPDLVDEAMAEIVTAVMNPPPESRPAELQESFQRLFLSNGETKEAAAALAKVAADPQSAREYW